MKIIVNKIIPFGNYETINLFGVLFTKSKELLSDKAINHESIHTAQMKEMLFIFFYFWYAIEYVLIRLFHKKQNAAYHDVSFEEEAYNNDKNLNYLNERKPYAWFKFIKIKSNK